MSMFQQVAHFLNQDMYHEFKIALSLGKWRSGEELTSHQRKICEEVVSIKEAYNFQQPETAYIYNEQESHKSYQTSVDNATCQTERKQEQNTNYNIADFMVVDTIQ